MKEPEVIISLKEYNDLKYKEALIQKDKWIPVSLISLFNDEWSLVLHSRNDSEISTLMGKITQEEYESLKGYKICLFKEENGTDSKT